MNKIFSLIIILSISSCSSIAFWQSDEVDPDEPRELIDFNNRFEFIENWEIKFIEGFHSNYKNLNEKHFKIN